MKELRQEGKIGQIPDYSPIMKPEFPNLFPFRLHGANLLHCRSPFLCASSTSNLGSLTHPAGDRPSHPNLISRAGKVLLEGMSRQILPLRLDAGPFLSRHSAQLFERSFLL